MTKQAIDPNKNRFLALIEKMAEDRKQTVEEFADLFHYTPDGVQFLRDNFWFNPSEALLRILAEEVELTVEEDQDLSELEFDSMDQTPADALFEMIQIFELLLSVGIYTPVMEIARQNLEDICCFEQMDSESYKEKSE